MYYTNSEDQPFMTRNFVFRPEKISSLKRSYKFNLSTSKTRKYGTISNLHCSILFDFKTKQKTKNDILRKYRVKESFWAQKAKFLVSDGKLSGFSNYPDPGSDPDPNSNYPDPIRILGKIEKELL